MREVLHNQQAVQALFMVKILNIRKIEERYGRAAVGKSIQDFAGRLRSCFRKSNILARYSGDEFMVSVIDVPSKEFIEKKCAELMQDEVKLEYSIGIAVAAGSGILSILVLSGETTREQAAASLVQPDLIVRDLGELGQWLAES